MIQCKSVMNRESIREAAKPLFKRVQWIYKLIGVVACILVAVTMGSKISEFDTGIKLLMIALGLFFCGIIILFGKREYKKTIDRFTDKLMQQLKDTYQTDCIEKSVVIEGCDITVRFGDDPDKHFRVDEIMNLFESDNYLIPQMKGRYILPIDKSSIAGASPEELKKLLSGH